MKAGANLVFPLMMVVLSAGAAGIYAADGDWRHCIYWLAAGVLAYTVTTF